MCVWTEKCGPCVFVWTKIQLCGVLCVCVCVCCVCVRGKIQRQVGILISSNICCSTKELSMLSRKGRHRTESFKNLLRGLVQTVFGKFSVIETLTY